MTDNLNRLRAARFAAEWKENNPDVDSGVYHLSGVEVYAQRGPYRRCTVTVSFEPEEKPVRPNPLHVEQHEAVSV